MRFFSRLKYINVVLKSQLKEFPSWLSGNKSDCYPWGFGFGPWPCSVGWGSRVAVSCGVGRRQGLDLALLWLWCRLAATAPIWPLAWELPCAMGVAQKKEKKKKRKHSSLPLGHWAYIHLPSDVIQVFLMSIQGTLRRKKHKAHYFMVFLDIMGRVSIGFHVTKPTF